MRFVLFAAICFCLAAPRADAADLTVAVTTGSGQPVADAVVTFSPETPYRGAIQFNWPMTLAQRNITFAPHVLIAPVGAVVSFPNFDRVRHHVYSFSAGNRFEINLYGQDQTRTYTFTHAGVAAIGCNIHDQMSAYVVIVDTPFAAKTDASGVVTLQGVSGAGTLRVWQENLRAPGNTLSQALTVGGNATKVAVTVRQISPAKSS